MARINLSPSPAPAKPQTPEPSTNGPAPTKEEIAAAGQLMVDKLFGPETPPVEPVVPQVAPADVIADEPAAPVEAAPAIPAAKVAPAPPAEPPAPPPQVEAPTTLETIQRTARMTAEAVAERLTPPVAPTPALELSAEDAADLKVLRYMAANDPKLAGLPDQFLAFTAKAYAYQDEWTDKHEGEEFKWDDEEHARWHAANAPKIDRAAIDEAKDDMRVEEKVNARLQPMIEKEQAEKAWQTAAPKVTARVNQLLVTMVDNVDPELGKMLHAADGTPDLSPEAVAKVEEADSVAHNTLDRIATNITPLLAELEKTGVPGLNYKLNPGSNPVHAAIARHVQAAEADILGAPAADQILDGKQFTSIAEMQSLRNQIYQGSGTNEQKQQKIRDLEATRTCLSIDDLQELIVDDATRRAKAEIERIDTLAKKKYVKNGNGAPAPTEKTGEPAPAAVAKPAAPASRFTRPPSMSSASDLITPGKPDASSTKTHGDAIVGALFK